MAFLDTSRIAWTYTADDGTVYRVAAVKALTDQAQQGEHPARRSHYPSRATSRCGE
jgi:hypothetical protein